MLHNHTPAVASGNEAVELIRILISQPESPLRNQLLETIRQAIVAPSHAEDALEKEVAEMVRDVPPFIRLPKAGSRCPHSGLSRTGLVELIAPCERNDQRPPVQAIYKRSHPRAKRGIWQIPSRNLFRHLLGQGQLTLTSFEAMREARKKRD